MAGDLGALDAAVANVSNSAGTSTSVVARQTNEGSSASGWSWDLILRGYKCEFVTPGFVVCEKGDSTYYCNGWFGDCEEIPRDEQPNDDIDPRTPKAEPPAAVPVDRHFADLNGNGIVDFPDFLRLSANFGNPMWLGRTAISTMTEMWTSRTS